MEIDLVELEPDANVLGYSWGIFCSCSVNKEKDFILGGIQRRINQVIQFRRWSEAVEEIVVAEFPAAKLTRLGSSIVIYLPTYEEAFHLRLRIDNATL